MSVDTEQTQRNWHLAGLVLALLLLLTMVLYQQTLLHLISVWDQLRTGEYAHGYLVLLISVYLIFSSRRRLAVLMPYSNYWALLAVLAVSLLWAVGGLVDVEVVQAAALLLLVLAIVWVVLGNQVTAQLIFPILFISFAIPIWFPLSPLLQNLTAGTAFDIVRALKIPAFLHENMIILPAGTLSVEESCSGMRYLLAALTLGALYGYLNYRSVYARLMVVFVAAIAAVLANIVRVFIVVYLGYVTQMQSPLVRDHMMLGWYLFGGLVIILLFIDAQVFRRWQAGHPASISQPDTSQLSDIKPVVIARGKLHYLVVAIAGILFLSVGPSLVYLISQQPTVSRATIEVKLPAGKAGWSGPVNTDDKWMPVYHGAAAKKQVYFKNGRRLFLYIGYYLKQRQGNELITFFNQINNTAVWRVLYSHAVTKDVDGRAVLEQLLVDKQGTRRLVWYWYNVSGINVANKYMAKVLEVLGLLTGKTDSYVVAVATDVNDKLKTSRELMTTFVVAMHSSLSKIKSSVQVSAGSSTMMRNHVD